MALPRPSEGGTFFNCNGFSASSPTGPFLCHGGNHSNAPITVHLIDGQVFGLFTRVLRREILGSSSGCEGTKKPRPLVQGLHRSRSRCARDPKNTPSSSARRPSPRESCRPIVGNVNVPIMVGVGAILLVVRLFPVARRHADASVGHNPQDVRRVWVVPYDRLERALEVIKKGVTASVPVPEVHRDVLVAVLVYGWMP